MANLHSGFSAERSAEKYDDIETDEASGTRELQADDPRWYGLTRSLYQFLRLQPRTWKELLAWGTPRGFKLDAMRMLLAALEHRREAYTDGTGQRLQWHAVVYKLRRRRCDTQ